MITRSSSRRTFIAKPRQALLAFLSKLAILIFVSLLWVSPADAQTGTSVDPFTHTSQAAYVTTSGRYTFNLGNGAFQADVDVAEGGAWILIGQYFHKGGTNPNLTVLAAGADFPVRSTAPLGTDEGAITAKWGHAGNAAMAQFTGDVELRFYGVTSGHGRIIHFKTPEGSDYVNRALAILQPSKQTLRRSLGTHPCCLPAEITGSPTREIAP